MLIYGNSKYIGLADETVHCAITSIPYWGLRDYGLEPQIWGGRGDCDHEWGDSVVIKRSAAGGEREYGSYDGGVGRGPAPVLPDSNFCRHCGAWRGSLGLEPTPDLFVANVVAIFREVWRVLRPDGTLWLNIGDTYATGSNGRSAADTKAAGNDDRTFRDKPFNTAVGGLKAKDLCMIPARVALALQADGWYLRSEIIWHKPNPMPESVTDRPTKAHEMVYLLTKNERYFYDAESIREDLAETTIERNKYGRPRNEHKWFANGVCHSNEGMPSHFGDMTPNPAGRNRRSVWTIATEPFPGAHYATFPTKLVEPCILAGTSAKGCCPECGAPWRRMVERIDQEPESYHGSRFSNGKTAVHQENRAQEGARGYTVSTGWQPTCTCSCADTVPAIVLDPFAGSGTVGQVARQLGRRFVGIDLNPSYLALNALPRAERGTSQAAIEELPLFSPQPPATRAAGGAS